MAKKMILLVDDDIFILGMQKRALAQYLKCPLRSIDRAVDGMQALQIMEERYERTGQAYDLVISDNNMPMMNGSSLYKKIKSQKFRPKEMLFTSAMADQLKRALGRDAECFSGKILEKPYDAEKFLGFAKKYLAKK